MIRLILRDTDTGAAAHIGGPVDTIWRTVDVDLPEVEAWLRETFEWHSREVVGVELLPKPAGREGGE
jgi:hypothetical protein